MEFNEQRKMNRTQVKKRKQKINTKARKKKRKEKNQYIEEN